MAPEQARGLKQTSPATDIYAVGTVLYESVTGRVPFSGDNFNDLMFKIVLAPRPNPADLEPTVDPELGKIILKAMSIDPAQRYATAEEFRVALVEWGEKQGAPLSTPEYRRSGGKTPRASSGRLANLSPGPSNASWEGETLQQSSSPVISGPPAGTLPAGTPIVSSSTSNPEITPTSRIRRNAAIAAGAALLVGAVVFAATRGGAKHPKGTVASATQATSTLAAAPPDPPPASAPAPPASEPQTIAVATQSAAAAPSPPSPPVGRVATTPRLASGRIGKPASAGTSTVAVAAPDAPPQKPPEPATPKPTEKLEGREILNSL
jgi:serine/threonine-protein kinase